MSDNFQIPMEIAKTDEDKRLVFGFAKFAEDPDNRGHLLIDKQGDVITPEELERSAYEYVLTARDAGEMHVTKGAATLVESVMITPEKLEAWGVDGDAVPQGWWVGYKVHEVAEGEADPFDKIKAGEYKAFSVEGTGIREPVVEKGMTPGSVFRKMIDWMMEYEEVGKHDAPNHPESAHGNRLFKPDADPVGNLLKQLKTRFKRTEANALQNLQAKFSASTAERDMLNHDQIVAELARRNLIKPEQMNFKSERFKQFRDEILTAITEEAGVES